MRVITYCSFGDHTCISVTRLTSRIRPQAHFRLVLDEHMNLEKGECELLVVVRSH